jgi:hypothetical protein
MRVQFIRACKLDYNNEIEHQVGSYYYYYQLDNLHLHQHITVLYLLLKSFYNIKSNRFRKFVKLLLEIYKESKCII